MRLDKYLIAFVAIVQSSQAKSPTKGPFLTTINDSEHVIVNDLWNVTIGQIYGTKLFYKDHDCVGDAVGHYVSYSQDFPTHPNLHILSRSPDGAVSNLNWTSVTIHKQTSEFLDVAFTADEGELHWVIFPGLAGAYQYFINSALPVLGEFRTLWRLDNSTFTNGKTDIKDGPLPTLAEIQNATKVQDETWLTADGTYITKYDWTDFLRNADYYGLYGQSFGSWYIDVGKDDYNGNQLKQELMVHRESSSGDTVQLNMIHGTHFMAVSSDAFPIGKIWGPWLWYLNDGSSQDASKRAKAEEGQYPYSWFDNEAYQSRGVVSGKLTLSDGRPANVAAVFLGDNNPNETSLDMGRFYYYTTYADENGNFEFRNVRTASYALQAWPNSSHITDVYTVFLLNDVTVSKGNTTTLKSLIWRTQGRKNIFQIGHLDRKSLGFNFGGAPHQHAIVARCPANLTYVVGKNNSAVLSVSLAGYSSGVTSSIILNNSTQVGNLTSENIPTDPCLYRSATTAGEWHYFEFSIADGILVKGTKTIDFTVTRTTLWHGFMWDSILLEYAGEY